MNLGRAGFGGTALLNSVSARNQSYPIRPSVWGPWAMDPQNLGWGKPCGERWGGGGTGGKHICGSIFAHKKMSVLTFWHLPCDRALATCPCHTGLSTRRHFSGNEADWVAKCEKPTGHKWGEMPRGRETEWGEVRRRRVRCSGRASFVTLSGFVKGLLSWTSSTKWFSTKNTIQHAKSTFISSPSFFSI